MSKVILENGVPFVAASKVSVFGTAGTNDIVKVLDFAGTEVTSDASIERVEFARPSTGYTYKATSTGVQVLLNGTVVSNLVNNQKLAFTDGSATVTTEFNPATASVVFKLGGVAVPTTAGAVAFTPNNGAGEASTITTGSGGTGSTAGQAFSLTATTETKSLTAGNDTVDATLADSLNGDSIIDASITDADTLNAVITANTSATLLNVEQVNIVDKFGGSTFTATNVSGGSVTLSSQYGTSTTITGVSGVAVNKVTAGDKLTGLTVNDISNNAKINVGGLSSLTLDGKTADADTATVTLTGKALTVTRGTDALRTLNLESATAANTVTLGTTSPVGTTSSSIAVSGDKSLTLKATGAQLDSTTGLASGITKSLTAGATLTVQVTDVSASANLSKIAADVIEVTGPVATNVITLADAGVLKVSANNGGNAVAINAPSTATAGTLTFQANADQTTGVTFGDKVVTAKLTADKAVNVGAVTIQNTAAASSVEKLVVTGSNDVAITSVTFQDATNGGVDASALTGKLTLGGIANNNLTKVVAGTGADTLTVAGATAVTVDGGAGSDTLDIGTQALAGVASVFSNIETLKSGTGATLNQQQVAVMKDSGLATLTASVNLGVTITTGKGNAIVDFSSVNATGSGVTFTATATDSDVTAVNLTGTNVADTFTFGAALSSADTVKGGAGTDIITVSGSVSDSAFTNVSSVETLNLTANSSSVTLGAAAQAAGIVTASGATSGGTIDASAYTAQITLTGGSGAGNVLKGGSLADTITAGAGQTNAITGGAGNDVITAGTGVDTIVFGATAAANGQDSISGFEVGAGKDVLDFTAFISGITTQDADGTTAGIQAYSATGTNGQALSGKAAIVTAAALTSVDQASEISALFATSGTTTPFTLGASEKAVVISTAAGQTTAYVWYVSNDATAALTASEVSLVGTITLSANYTDGGIVAANFA